MGNASQTLIDSDNHGRTRSAAQKTKVPVSARMLLERISSRHLAKIRSIQKVAIELLPFE
jgi:hypothetical protein